MNALQSKNRHSFEPDKPIRIRNWTKASLAIRGTLVTLVLLTLYAFLTFDYKDVVIWDGFVKTAETFRVMLFQAELNHFTFVGGLFKVLITLGLAFLTTLFGAIISVFLGLFAAQNLSTTFISRLIRAFVAFIRAVPTVLWVLIFAVSAGLGSVAAVVGMTFHSIGYLVKAYSESFEELDKGVIEALKASGAGWWQIVFQAVLPSCISSMISWTFVRFEINFAVAVAMGAAAGAGGIGFDMFMASGFYFDLREIGAITLYILVFATILELLASRLKKNLRVIA
jgi:phosphonate transport system permease protein